MCYSFIRFQLVYIVCHLLAVQTFDKSLNLLDIQFPILYNRFVNILTKIFFEDRMKRNVLFFIFLLCNIYNNNVFSLLTSTKMTYNFKIKGNLCNIDPSPCQVPEYEYPMWTPLSLKLQSLTIIWVAKLMMCHSFLGVEGNFHPQSC